MVENRSFSTEKVEAKFKPRVNLQSGRKISGAEILIFYDGKPPQVFVEKAKCEGSANLLYTEMVKKALPTLKEALKINPELVFSLKLYRLSLEDIKPVNELLEIFRKEGIPFSNVEFEANMQLLRENLGEEVLKHLSLLSVACGFVLETDGEICIPQKFIDKFLVQKVKLSRVLLDWIFDEKGFTFGRGVKFAKALVEFFKRVDLSVLVDGVKTEPETELLFLMGVDEVQGPLYGEALTGEEFLKLVKENSP